MSIITIYHGSSDIIKTPRSEFKNPFNDFGKGFYCTSDFDFAGEWACQNEDVGYINKYELDAEGLKILDLTSNEYNILNWLAILVDNHDLGITSIRGKKGIDYILNNFLPNYRDFDIIIGYPADNSYLSYINSFLLNEISLKQLAYKISNGEFGEQIVLKSKKAIEALKYIDCIIADNNLFYSRCKARDLKLRDDNLDYSFLNEFGLLNDVYKIVGSYDKAYLKEAMDLLGRSFDYAVNVCQVPLEKFINLFISSGYAKLFEDGNPKIISGLLEVEFVKKIMNDLDDNLNLTKQTVNEDYSNEYIFGNILAYYQWYKARPFKDIIRDISIEELQKICISSTKTSNLMIIDTIDNTIKNNNTISNIQRQRKISGYSQKELSDKSGVNLRTLQQYELKTKDINKASVKTVIAMAKVLGCDIEEILEY